MRGPRSAPRGNVDTQLRALECRVRRQVETDEERTGQERHAVASHGKPRDRAIGVGARRADAKDALRVSRGPAAFRPSPTSA
jgi:hypothetical protein